MVDSVLLDAFREFLAHEDDVRERYLAVFEAYSNRLDKVTVIIGKATEGDSANAQMVVNARDYRTWMATLKARLDEMTTGTTAADQQDTEHVTFSNRYLST